MNRYIFLFLIAAFSLLLHAKCVAQKNIAYGAGITYTVGVPTFVPPGNSSRVVIDTVTSKWYEYATPGGWRWSGDRVQDISGCAAPAYTPGKAQSRLVLNACTEAQNGHGPELYKYTGSAWLCLNCGGNYTAGTGIDITGAEITNTAPDQVVSITGAGINAITGTYPNFTVTGTEVDGSTTNELQTLSVAGNNLTISDGNTVTLPTPSSTLDGLTDVTITTPANNQILQYNSAGSQWVNATLSAIAGSGADKQVAYWTSSGTQSGSDNMTWDNTLKLFSIKSAGATASEKVLSVLDSDGTQFFSAYGNGSIIHGKTFFATTTFNGYSSSWNIGNTVSGGIAGQVSAMAGSIIYNGAQPYYGARALNYNASNRGTSTANQITGAYLVAQNETASSRAYFLRAIDLILLNNSSAGTVEEVSGVNIAIYANGSTILETTGVKIGDLTPGGTQTNVYSVYSTDVLASMRHAGKVAIGSVSSINQSAAMEVKSTTGVMVPPNMTSTQRDAIGSPPNGIIFNTTTGKFQGYAAGTWVDFH